MPAARFRLRRAGRRTADRLSRPVSAAHCLTSARRTLVRPTPGDAGPLVAQQELRVGPALILFSDKLIGGYPDVFEEHLVDLVAAVDQLDRPHRDPGGVQIDEQKRDAGLLLGRLRVGAHQAENPVGVLAQRRPGLLPVDDVAVAVPQGGGAQRCQIRAGFGLGEPLAPPDVEAGRRRQEALLDLLGAELGDHRSDHLGVEVQRFRHARPAASRRARSGAERASSPCRPTRPASWAPRARDR